MKQKNWTNTDTQGLSDAHDTEGPLIGSGLLCARLARDTRGTPAGYAPDQTRPILLGSWGLGPHSLVPQVQYGLG